MYKLIDEAESLGFGVNLGFRPDKRPRFSCAIFRVFRSVKAEGSYACKQGDSFEEVLRLCLEEVKTPAKRTRPGIDLTQLLTDLNLTLD